MKKLISVSLVAMVAGSSLFAGDFENKLEMMKSRIDTKMEKLSGNSVAIDFLNKKLVCVKAAHSVSDLKSCKKEFHPKRLKSLIK